MAGLHVVGGVVQDCARAVEALLPDLAAWALHGSRDTRTWTLALVAYDPDVWASLGVDVAQLLAGLDAATADLVHHAVSGMPVEETLIAPVIAPDDDLRDYYDEAISELPQDQRARRLVLELAVTECL